MILNQMLKATELSSSYQRERKLCDSDNQLLRYAYRFEEQVTVRPSFLPLAW